MMAWERSGEINLPQFNADNPWLPYSWKTREVFPLTAEETWPKRRRSPNGTYMDNSSQSVGDVTTVPWWSLERLVTTDDCRWKIIDVRESKMVSRLGSRQSWKVRRTEYQPNRWVVAESVQLRASVGTLTANNSTLWTEKAAVKVLLEIKKAKYDSLNSANSVLSACVDELDGEVRNLTENATQLFKKNVDLMELVAAL